VNSHRLAAAVVAVTAMAVLLVGIASAKNFSAWAPAQKIDEIGGNSAELNTAALDGCPIQSPDGLSLYMASNGRAGTDSSTSGSRTARASTSLGERP
jgi:hypothetical protein